MMVLQAILETGGKDLKTEIERIYLFPLHLPKRCLEMNAGNGR